MRLGFVFALLLLTEVAWGFGAGPLNKRTGAAIDGGLNCAACHRTFAPADRDPRGRVLIESASYRPGVKQTLRITVSHPDSARWGFQITARRADNQTVTAGVFTANENIRVACGDATTLGPCTPGQLEFATHSLASSRAGANGSATYQVEWTPPAEDVGDVIFYAAGNAADGNGTPTNDVIYTTRLVVRNGAGCTLSGASTVSGVSNAASGRPGLGYNTLFSIYGTNLMSSGRSRSPQAFDLGGGRFPTQLDCVAVEVDGRRVPVTFASSAQINAQAPAVLSGTGRVDVIVNPGTPNERRVSGGTFPISDVQPAFFTFGEKNVAALFADLTTPVALPGVVPGGRAARADDVIVIFANGLGATNPVWQAGEITQGQSPLLQQVVVEIGGKPAEVLYSGLSPESISGLYQLNVRVPSGLAAGDALVVLRVAGATTQNGTVIPVL